MLVHTLMLNKGSPAGLAIQAALARAIDRGKFAVVANLDLSCAFDLVNIKLLIKRMRLLGLPRDLVIRLANESYDSYKIKCKNLFLQ